MLREKIGLILRFCKFFSRSSEKNLRVGVGVRGENGLTSSKHTFSTMLGRVGSQIKVTWLSFLHSSYAHFQLRHTC